MNATERSRDAAPSSAETWFVARWSRLLFRILALFAVAFWGYWLATLAHSVIAQTLLFPLGGAAVEQISLHTFSASVSNASIPAAPVIAGLLHAAPVALCILLALFGARKKGDSRPLLGLFAGYAGICALLFLAFDLFLLARFDGGPLGSVARLLHLSFVLTTARGVITSVAATLLLLGLAYLVVRELVCHADGLRGGDSVAGNLFPAFLIAVPIPLLIWGRFGWRWHFSADYLLLILAVPSLIVFLLAGYSLLRFRFQAGVVRSIPVARAAGLTGGALLLASALALFPTASTWWGERQMAVQSSGHFEFQYDAGAYSGKTVTQLAARAEQALKEQCGRLQLSGCPGHIRVILYHDFAAARRATGTHRPWQVEGTTVRLVLTGYIQHIDPASIAAALLDAAWETPGSALARDWTARWLAGEWRGTPIRNAASSLQEEVGPVTTAALVTGQSDGEISPLIREPLGASWIDWLKSQGGLKDVRRFYELKSADLSVSYLARLAGLSPAAMQGAWYTYLGAANPEIATASNSGSTKHAPVFFRGVSFAMEGYGTSPGTYSSAVAAEQLKQIHKLSANAVSLMPFGFVDSLHDTEIRYIETGETDEDVRQAAWVAHQLGMMVMLKPQIWVGRGEFTGDIQFTEPVERQQWMASYRQFILHYALLAEQEHIELLCVGTELGGMTGDEQGWRSIISDVRRIYDGQLTYAANWGAEFDSIQFWDALDYAGVNNYYPLAKRPSASVDDLAPGAKILAEHFTAFYRRWRLPILFTEVGYPSVHGAAVEPWIQDPAKGIRDDEQAACYEAIFQAFCSPRARRAAPPGMFAGMFWWKWPSDGGGGGSANSSYSPVGKPAQKVMRDWFEKLSVSSPAATN